MRVYETHAIRWAKTVDGCVSRVKESKLNNRAKNHGGGKARIPAGKLQRPRHAFTFGAKATGRGGSQPKKLRNHGVEAGGADRGQAVPAGNGGDSVAGGAFERVQLTETIKALLEVAREQNHLTYDDINDVLPY